MSVLASVFSPERAAIRFGTGLSPVLSVPRDIGDLMAELTGTDDMAWRYPVGRFMDEIHPLLGEIKTLSRLRKRTRGTPQSDEAHQKIRSHRLEAKRRHAHWLRQHLLRGMDAPVGFRERLALFWGDHFTVKGKAGILRQATSSFTEEAVRPHLTGFFDEMLIAAVTHPLMLLYLDQFNSYGPNSPVNLGRRNPGGLNENLAREVLELHTLGVDGPYTQRDVAELAELLTGMTYDVFDGPYFWTDAAEPGAETVLGQSYAPEPGRAPIEAVLRDLAVHPATARHLARKLAVHFVSDAPDPALVEHMAARYLAADGALLPMYEALLEHPAAWEVLAEARNVKPPLDFVMSALRALDMPRDKLGRMNLKGTVIWIAGPMSVMGQTFEAPVGPDGWPEDDGAWVTPQGIAGRVQWAMAAPKFLIRELPDPRDFVTQALGAEAPEEVRFAAAAAESRWEGVGLVLASPAFQRR